MQYCPPASMRLSEFLKDYLRRADSIRPSTKTEYAHSMRHFIKTVGDIDILQVDHNTGERYRGACLEQGNRPHTVTKKIRQLRAMFSVGIDQKKLEENPLSRVKTPRVPTNTIIRTYTPDERSRLIKAASEFQDPDLIEWNLLILIALTTAARKSELLNLTWSDIDFFQKIIMIRPKEETKETWFWDIKDYDHRELPLTDVVLKLLIEHRKKQPQGYPYVLIPVHQYDRIQNLRKKGKWDYEDTRISIVHNFTRQFKEILKLAGIVGKKTFHDLRRTAITGFFHAKMQINDVRILAGHSKLETTCKYYWAAERDYLDTARQVGQGLYNNEMVEGCWGKNTPAG
jgi:integrase